jgi:hypothetical protein
MLKLTFHFEVLKAKVKLEKANNESG